MLPMQVGGGRRSNESAIREFLHRAVHYDHMDLEYTFWQMFYLCVAPARVYRTTKLHKQTKNQWARDDPAFLVVLVSMVAVASLAYAVAFRASSVWVYLRVVLSAIVFDFFVIGACIATVAWWFANTKLRVPPTVHNVEQRVEWMYAFDVHCNSYFPLFLVIYVAQFFLIPLLLKEPCFLCTFLANTLYACACCYYWYITFLGYQVLPFLTKTTIFLYPCVGVGSLYVVGLVTRTNISVWILSMYFGH